MTETSPEPAPPVHVTLCSAEEAVVSHIQEYSHPDFVKTRITRLDSISGLLDPELKPPDVLVIDITDDCDTDSLFSASARNSLAGAEIIVLCAAEDSAKWQERVLQREIADCFIIRPLHDPGYLKVQIWRAIRASLEKDNEAPSDDDNGEPAESCAKTSAPDKSTAPSSPFAGMQALVLEDDDPSAEAMTDMLTQFGFTVKRAPTVVEGCRNFSNLRFDVFLVDLMMPGISGADVIKAVRENLKGEAAPIIVTSAFSEDDLVRDCIEEGAAGYIIKPITRARLLPRLRDVLEKE